MNEVILIVAGRAVTGAEALTWLAAGGLAAVLIVALALLRLAAARARRDHDADARLAEVVRLQAETAGRLQAMADSLGGRQSELSRAVSERLDGLTHRLGRTLAETTRQTNEHLGKLNERLAVVDRAQKSLGELSGEMLQLKTILADKQARGAFGQGRMEAIVADALPPAAFSFQATLSNGTRPDCLIHLPNGAAPLAIDAKFPLEGWTAWRAAETPEARSRAETQLRRDVATHIRDIRDKYLIPGETQDTAFLFVPSESLFADLNEHFDELIQRAHRARVVLVSPALLLLSIQVVQAVLRDHRMREEAHLVQNEVALLLDDVERLVERVAKLATHFDQTARDVEQISISADKVRRRATRIEDMDLAAPAEAPAAAVAAAPRAAVVPGPGFDRRAPDRLAGE
jgi:DNA recombination protein RmuC